MKRQTDDRHQVSHLLDDQLGLIRDAAMPPDAQQRLRQGMRQAWDALEHPATGRRRPSWGNWRVPARVAAAMVVIGALVGVVAATMFFFAPRTVYAQALEAVRQAEAVYASGFLLRPNGQHAKEEIEIWFAEGLGVRETIKRDNGTVVRLDDGESEWLYRSDTHTVTKRPSQDPIGEIHEFLQPLKMIEKRDGRRDTSLDRVLHGRQGHAWVVTKATRGTPARYVVWLDSDNRLLRFEEQDRPGDQWIVTELAELRYDVPLPEGVFVASFPKDARLIDWTQGTDLAVRYPLDGAIATAERLGLILAVHEVRRVDADTIYVMCTTRGSKQVIEAVGPIPPRSAPASYGKFTWSSNGRRMPDHRWVQDYSATSLAQWEHDGVQYEWLLLRHINPQLSEELPVGFHVHAHGSYRQKLEAEGRTFYLWGEKDVLTLQLPEQPEGLETVLDEVYQQVAVFEGINRRSRLGGLRMPSVAYSPEQVEREVARGTPRSEAGRMSTMTPAVPSEIAIDDWAREVRAILNEQDQLRSDAAAQVR